MNREQFKALIAVLEPMLTDVNRRDAFERAMRVLDGKATFDEVFGSAWGERTWGVEPWGEVRRLGTADGKVLGDGRRLGESRRACKDNE